MSDAGKIFKWLRQVCADRQLPPAAFHVALVLCQWANWRTGEMSRSQEDIADELGLTVRGVRRILAGLRDGGHLQITAGRGRGNISDYRLACEKRNEKRNGESSFEGLKADSSVRVTGEKSGLSTTLKSGLRSPLHKETHLNKNQLDAADAAADAASGDLFETVSPVEKKAPPDAELYRRGREILGKSAGGLIKQLLVATGNSIPQARAALEVASEKSNPREYIGGVIKKKGAGDGETFEDRQRRGVSW